MFRLMKLSSEKILSHEGGNIMMIFGWLLVGVVIYYLVRNNGKIEFNNNSNNDNKTNDAVNILKKRYAAGEIDDETYERMINNLNN